MRLNLFDSNFPAQHSSVYGKTPRTVEWVRNQMTWDGVTVFTDAQMYNPVVDEVQSPVKIGWLHEGRELHPSLYDLTEMIEHKFDFILTHDASLIAKNPRKYRFTIRGGVWTPQEKWHVYPKSRDISMIISEKCQTSGHQLRHIVAGMGLPIDCYGALGVPIGADKSIAYRDYRYALVIEASRTANFFTEHLLDAIAFGCVPIYWGCPNIGIWLHRRSFIDFETPSELATLLPTCTAAHYNQVVDTCHDNLTLLYDYEVTEDWFAQVHLSAYQHMLEAGR